MMIIARLTKSYNTMSTATTKSTGFSMKSASVACLLVVALSYAGSSLTVYAGRHDGSRQISIKMPDIRPDHASQYLCIAHRLPRSHTGEFIVGFNPRASADKVHHMLLYGCSRPGIYQRDSPNFVWDCGEMHSSTERDSEITYEQGPICRGKPEILYGWALDAPALKMPKGVGFEVSGHDTGIDYLVLQVHYGHMGPFLKNPELTDNSGLLLDSKPNVPTSGITKRAGVLVLMSYGMVARGTSKHEIWCDINEDIELHPFRYRVHTHKLGTRVMGIKLGPDSPGSISGLDDNHLSRYEMDDNRVIGVGDPQKPQMFYPVKERDLVITRGDKLYATCEFNNTLSHPVPIGQTSDDEMCNFYVMYWTDSSKISSPGICVNENPKRRWTATSSI